MTVRRRRTVQPGPNQVAARGLARLADSSPNRRMATAALVAAVALSATRTPAAAVRALDVLCSPTLRIDAAHLITSATAEKETVTP